MTISKITDLKVSASAQSKQLVEKINELVDAVNKLEQQKETTEKK